jgi:hypothetical protein
MTKAIRFAWAAFAVVALLSVGCSNSNDQSSGSGGKSSSAGSSGSAGSGGGAGSGGSASKSSSAGSASSGGKSSASSGGGSGGSSSGGSSTSSPACDTADGTYQESTTFQTSGATAPYTLNKWGTWGNATEPTLTQTTTGASGVDCGSGCAALTIDFSSGTKQYSAGSFVEFFGTSADSVTNLLNETITVKIALAAKQASGANKDVPISISLFGQDPTTSSNGVDNLWVYDLGSASSLDAASGWHTLTFKVVDAKVPSWSPTRTVCASGMHAIGITIQNNSAIDDSNGSVVTLYVQSVTVGNGSGGSGGSGGGTGGSGVAGQGGSSSGGTTGGGSTASGGTGGGTGGATSGGTSGTGSGGVAGGSTGGLPRLQVSGTKLQDPSGKTIVLRGSSLMDIGTLYVSGGKSIKGITDRIDKVMAAGVQGHVVRLPVYPRNNVNTSYPFYSELPYPVGANAPNNKATSGNTVIDMTSDDYISKVLKPAVDYATGKNLYVIIDFHQIDDATKGQTATDANTFWTTVAPVFASYTNVIYEAFNEPIDQSATWSALKPVAQGWVDTIRKGAPDNVIIVPSLSYCQKPGDAASDPPKDPKSNLMFTAHVYPGNWKDAFKTQVSTAVAKAPVFFTEWGYVLNGSDANLGTSSTTWGSDFQTLVNGNGGSWTAWVADNSWTPNMFSDSAISQLSDFGKLVNSWLVAKANSDWVQ